MKLILTLALLCGGCAHCNATPSSLRASPVVAPQEVRRAAPQPSPALVSLARGVAALRVEVDAGRVQINAHTRTQEHK